MARNAEKAMTTLARWRAAKEAETGKNERRPYLASECTDVKKCEKWRIEIIREISKKVAQIQNAGLGEFRIRDLNDEINKLLREKRHWENQISNLGGPHYRFVGYTLILMNSMLINDYFIAGMVQKRLMQKGEKFQATEGEFLSNFGCHFKTSSKSQLELTKSLLDINISVQQKIFQAFESYLNRNRHLHLRNLVVN